MNNIKQQLDNLHLNDIYSLMLFILYKVKEIPEYAVLSEMCSLLDGSNLNRLLTYFAGQTIKIPTKDEFVITTNALLLYQYINIEGETLVAATQKLDGLTGKQKEAATDLYFKIIPFMQEYNLAKISNK